MRHDHIKKWWIKPTFADVFREVLEIHERGDLIFHGYNDLPNVKDEPYIPTIVIAKCKRYNPTYGNERICICGAKYYEHFDEEGFGIPQPIKHNGCSQFVKDEQAEDIDYVQSNMMEYLKRPPGYIE